MIKPKIVTLTNSSADVLNLIRNNASVYYRDHVPVATSDADCIRQIGAIIMDYTALQNEFLNVLVNRIGRVWVTSKLYQNPIAMFKKGVMDLGETIEDVFINLIDAQDFDPAVAESELFKREKPDVRSAFYTLNYQKFYKVNISYEQLRQAFLTSEGMYNLTGKIVEQMYTSANYDEFLTMKYLLARNILNGRLYPVSIGANPETNPRYSVSVIKGVSNDITFLKTDYNVAGVYNHTLKDDQYLLINSKFDAVIDVEVLAQAFNMTKAEFMGHVVLIDSFGSLDTARLNMLFANDGTYEELSDAEVAALDSIPCVLVDRDYFIVVDNLITTKELENAQGLNWNYFLHTWKTFAVSPFASAVVFVPMAAADMGVTSVTVAPDAVTVDEGFTGSIQLSPTVVTTGYVPQTVKYEVKDAAQLPTGLGVTVDGGGNVTISHTGATAAFDAEVTIKCSSTYDPTKYDECVITIGEPGEG